MLGSAVKSFDIVGAGDVCTKGKPDYKHFMYRRAVGSGDILMWVYESCCLLPQAAASPKLRGGRLKRIWEEATDQEIVSAQIAPVRVIHKPERE